MALEPIILYARIADPAKVARKLRELVPPVEIDGPDESWRNAVIAFGRGETKQTLTFTHDHAYYSEPNWSTQMHGMQGYFSHFPNSDRKERVMMLTTTFHFSLGTFFEPDFNPGGDPRLEVLFEIAKLLDGVLFTPSSLRDAHGRILFGAGGEDAEDHDAVWPRVAGEVSISKPLGAEANDGPRPTPPDDDGSHNSKPHSAQRVARRALALTAVTARAMLENGESVKSRLRARNSFGWVQGLFASRESQRRDLLVWIEQIGIGEELEPDEWEILQRPVGKLDQRMQIDATWRLESLVVLAWALGRFEIPPHDRLVKWTDLWDSLGLRDFDKAKALLDSPTPRSREQIRVLRNQLFAVHWRLRNFSLRPDAIDFVEFASSCWFGPLDTSRLHTIEGDLALRGKRIDRVSAALFSTVESTARERHQAANWLWEGPERYSETSQAT